MLDPLESFEEMDAAPHARADGLLVEALTDGLGVYDARSGAAYSLDPVTGRVWRSANGRRTRGEIAAAAGVGEPAVLAALDQLEAAGLLTPVRARRALPA